MFKNKLSALFVIVSVIIVSCSKTNDNYKHFIDSGEIEYSNKIDSVVAFNGFNRAKITASLFNGVTVKEIVVSWDKGENKVRFPYQKSENDIDALELIIPDLEVRSYRFSVYSVDNQGAESVKVDAFTTVYGDTFQSNLEAKSFLSTSANTDSLSIKLSSSSALERDSEFKYFDKTSGEEFVITTMPADEGLVLNNIDFSKEVQYRTFYMPNEGAIDEVGSDWVTYIKPQNIVDLLSNVIFTPKVRGVSIDIPNPTNTILDVEFTNMVGGVPKVTTITSSDNPITFEVVGLENGSQDVYLGLNDASKNQVVETYQIAPIGIVNLDRSTWTIHSFKTETVNSNRAWGAVNVIDADLTSLWRSAHPTVEDSDFPQWIVIDMQEVKTIDAIKIMGPDNGKGHSKHTWEISDDGINFTLIGTFDMANIATHQTNTLAAPAIGRYLKYTATEPGTNETVNRGSRFSDYVYDIQPGIFQ
jgi:hypothetical protein